MLKNLQTQLKSTAKQYLLKPISLPQSQYTSTQSKLPINQRQRRLHSNETKQEKNPEVNDYDIKLKHHTNQIRKEEINTQKELTNLNKNRGSQSLSSVLLQRNFLSSTFQSKYNPGREIQDDSIIKINLKDLHKYKDPILIYEIDIMKIRLFKFKSIVLGFIGFTTLASNIYLFTSYEYLFLKTDIAYKSAYLFNCSYWLLYLLTRLFISHMVLEFNIDPVRKTAWFLAFKGVYSRRPKKIEGSFSNFVFIKSINDLNLLDTGMQYNSENDAVEDFTADGYWFYMKGRPKQLYTLSKSSVFYQEDLIKDIWFREDREQDSQNASGI